MKSLLNAVREGWACERGARGVEEPGGARRGRQREARDGGDKATTTIVSAIERGDCAAYVVFWVSAGQSEAMASHVSAVRKREMRELGARGVEEPGGAGRGRQREARDGGQGRRQLAEQALRGVGLPAVRAALGVRDDEGADAGRDLEAAGA